MTNPANPPITRRLFYCPDQERFFWINYNSEAQHYIYACDAIMTLDEIKVHLGSYLIPERRFWDGPNRQHIWLPFNKARCRAFYCDRWQPLDILRALNVVEVPVVESLPPATADFAPGVVPKGAFTTTKFARSRKTT